MPYLWCTFVEEGDFQGLLDAIDVVVEKHPQHLLHGHEPLTRNFGSFSMLARLKTDMVWLREQVLIAVRRGDERAAIYQANLIPPGLLGGQSDVYQPYLILREHVIDRLYEKNVGYWQPNLQGLDHLGRADRAELLVDYLGLSEKQLVKTVERLVANGKYELAASLLESSGSRFEHSTSVASAKRLVYLKLMEEHKIPPVQVHHLFDKIGEETPQMASRTSSSDESLSPLRLTKRSAIRIRRKAIALNRAPGKVSLGRRSETGSPTNRRGCIYYAFPREHWRGLRANNPIEIILREMESLNRLRADSGDRGGERNRPLDLSAPPALLSK